MKILPVSIFFYFADSNFELILSRKKVIYQKQCDFFFKIIALAQSFSYVLSDVGLHYPDLHY